MCMQTRGACAAAGPPPGVEINPFEESTERPLPLLAAPLPTQTLAGSCDQLRSFRSSGSAGSTSGNLK